MNADELLAAHAEALHREYEAYNLPGALQDLEDRVINTEANTVLHPHPAPERHGGWVIYWTDRAACKGTDPDELAADIGLMFPAKLLCRGCPVRAECLADALDFGIEFGMWGGMTVRERRALRRRRPDVTSWRELLMKARHEYQRQQQEAEATGEQGHQEAAGVRGSQEPAAIDSWLEQLVTPNP